MEQNNQTKCTLCDFTLDYTHRKLAMDPEMDGESDVINPPYDEWWLANGCNTTAIVMKYYDYQKEACRFNTIHDIKYCPVCGRKLNEGGK